MRGRKESHCRQIRLSGTKLTLAKSFASPPELMAAVSTNRKGFKARVRLLGESGQLLRPVQSHATIVLKIDKGVEDIDASRMQCCRKTSKFVSSNSNEDLEGRNVPVREKGARFVVCFTAPRLWPGRGNRREWKSLTGHSRKKSKFRSKKSNWCRQRSA